MNEYTGTVLPLDKEPNVGFKPYVGEVLPLEEKTKDVVPEPSESFNNLMQSINADESDRVKKSIFLSDMLNTSATRNDSDITIDADHVYSNLDSYDTQLKANGLDANKPSSMLGNSWDLFKKALTEPAPKVEISEEKKKAANVGAVEAVGALATMIPGVLGGVSAVVGRIEGAAVHGEELSWQIVEEAFNKGMGATSYQPKTEVGKKDLEFLMTPFTKANEIVSEWGDTEEEKARNRVILNAVFIGLPLIKKGGSSYISYLKKGQEGGLLKLSPEDVEIYQKSVKFKEEMATQVESQSKGMESIIAEIKANEILTKEQPAIGVAMDYLEETTPAVGSVAAVEHLKETQAWKVIDDNGKKIIEDAVDKVINPPVKSQFEQLIEAEQAKMRESQAQGKTREQQLEETKFNAIKTGKALDMLIDDKSLGSHIDEKIASMKDLPEADKVNALKVAENNVRELLMTKFAKETDPIAKKEILDAEKRLNKDFADAYEKHLTGELAEGKTTSAQNAVTDAEREAAGLPPIEKTETKPIKQSFEEGKKTLVSGEFDIREAEKIVEKARPISDVETVALEGLRVKNNREYDTINDRIAEAKKKGNTEEVESLIKDRERLEIDRDTIDNALKSGGTEGGRAQRIRQEFMAQDFSLATMIRRAKADSPTGEITEVQRAEYAEIAKKIEVAKAELDALNEKIAQKASQDAVDKIIARERKTKRTQSKQALDTEWDSLTKELDTLLSTVQLNVGFDPKAVVILGKMARNRIMKGVLTIEEIVADIHNTIKDKYSNVTERDIRDAISGYGKTIQLTKKEIDIQLAEAKRQGKLISALEDAERGEMPLLKQKGASYKPSERVLELRKQVKEAMIENGLIEPKLNPDEVANKRFKTYAENRIKKLEQMIAEGDFAKKEKREVPYDKESLDARFKLDQAIKEYQEKQFNWQMENRTTLQKVGSKVMEAVNLSRAIKTAFDLSAVLRQGAFIVLGHPIRGIKNIPDMFKALKSEKGQFEVEQGIINHPNYKLADKSGLYLAEHGHKLTSMEEVYMSRWAEKIPGVAASARAYTTFLNKLRFDSFNRMVENLVADSKKPTEIETKAIANYINIATGRGNFGMKQNALVGLNTVFFAPRYVASRFQLLMGQPLLKGTANTRIMIAKEYARFLIGVGTVYTLSKAMGADIEIDPRSPDFGKIKLGNTRIDPLAGLSQTSVFLGQEILGAVKNPKGKIIPIREQYVWDVNTPVVPYKGEDAADIIKTFLRKKLSPVAGTGIDIFAGKDVIGKPVTAWNIPEKLMMPLAFNDIYSAMQEQGVPAGAALGLLSIFGMGLQSYSPYDAKEEKRKRIERMYNSSNRNWASEIGGSMVKKRKAVNE